MTDTQTVSNTVDSDALFESFDLDGLELPNRIVMAPMTRSRVGDGDVTTQMTAEYYTQRATSGLIVSEAIVISPEARGYLFTPGLYSEEQIQAWARVVESVHNAQGRIFAQLWHCGRVSHHSVLPEGAHPLSPTDRHEDSLSTFGRTEAGNPGRVVISPPRAMTEADIVAAVTQFANAARNAVRARFDGLEILAGNGYLIEQFLNAESNTRTDAYGGESAENRTRFLLEIIDAIREEVGYRVRIAVRLSPYGLFNGMQSDDKTEETYLFLAGQLQARGVTYVHFNDEPVSIGHLNEDVKVNVGAQTEKTGTRRLIPGHFYRSFREAYLGAVIVCGALTKEVAADFLGRGEADLAAFGTSFIANPDLPARLANDLPLASPRTELFYGGGEAGYTDYEKLS